MSRAIAPIPVIGLSVPVLEALASLHRACFPDEPWDASAVGDILRMPGTFGYTAWEDGDPAGFVLAGDLGGETEILALGTVPERRRRGLGCALMESVAGEARRRGSASIVLEAAADNVAALALYARLGFVPVGRRPRYYRRIGGALADALILRRRLTGDGAAN